MHRRRFGKLGYAGLILLVALQVRCDGGPSGTVTLNVGGEWIEISTLVVDNCNIGLPPTTSSDLTIIPSGNQITFVFHSDFGDTILTGTFNSRTGDFSLTFSDQADGISITAVQSGRFSSNSRYTSTSEIVLTEGGQSCTIRTSETGQRRS